MNWKAWAAILAFVVALGFGIRQFYAGWSERPPAGFQFRERSSPTLDSKMRQRLKDLQREPLASLVVIQVGRYGQRDTVWSTEVFRNDGFDPMQHFERGTIGKATHLLGFYTLDGEPLNFTEKGQPHAPERTLLTVHIAEPLAAGATQLVLRVEQRISVVQKGKDGAYVVRAPGVDRRRAGWYVRAIETPDGQFQTWSATESDRQAPLAVTFRYP